jgi:hypothetical protein
MGNWLKIGECDYNVLVIENQTFEEFKHEGKHSFSIGKSDAELQYIYDLILSVNGNVEGVEKKSAVASRKGSKNSGTGAAGQQKSSG